MTTAVSLDNPALVAPPHTMRIAEPLALECGHVLPGHTVSFETYGTLAAARDNAILVCHSLTKGAHAAGRHAARDPRSGWWDAAIGPGQLLDTDRYFVICADTLAAGRSCGPASPDPATGKPYGMRFPVVTVRDMVNAQQQLFTRLGIERLHAVIGGCFGGQQAIEWAIQHPDQVGNAVVITTTPATSAHSIAIFAVMRRLIRGDPAWNGGDYYGESFPAAGLGAAIAAAVPLWMSAEAMDARFGRRPAAGGPADPGRAPADPAARRYTLDAEFEVESFIARLAAQAGNQLDPNSLMYLTRAVEYFDLEREYGRLEQALAPVTARVLFLSYRGDWRYPAAETDRMHQALLAVGRDSRHVVLDSGLGHGAFLFDVAGLAAPVADFLVQRDG
jgi:homoserine O-acetyltransferase/O-succinyltransferase